MRFRRSFAVLTVALLAACGGDESAERSATVSTTVPAETGGGESTETTETTEAPAGELTDALLTLDDMPTGWVPAPEFLEDDDEDDGECEPTDMDLADDAEARSAFKPRSTGEVSG